MARTLTYPVLSSAILDKIRVGRPDLGPAIDLLPQTGRAGQRFVAYNATLAPADIALSGLEWLEVARVHAGRLA